MHEPLRAKPCARVLVWILVVGLSSASAWGSPEGDQVRNAARRLAETAADHFDAGDYAGARDLFQRAQALVHAPTLALWEARCLVKLGRLVEAEERYTSVARFRAEADAPEPIHKAVAEASSELEQLRSKIPILTIALQGISREGTAQIRLDGRAVPPSLLGVAQPVDPGEHWVAIVVGPTELLRTKFPLAEGEHRRLDLTVPAPAHESRVTSADRSMQQAEPTGLRWVALGLGVGTAGLATGIATGLAAMNRHAELEQHCPGGNCPPNYHDDLNTYRTLRTVSTVAYITGALGAGGATLAWLMRHNSLGTVALLAGPTSLQLAGEFQ